MLFIIKRDIYLIIIQSICKNMKDLIDNCKMKKKFKFEDEKNKYLPKYLNILVLLVIFLEEIFDFQIFDSNSMLRASVSHEDVL